MATQIDKTKVATGEDDPFLLCWARGDNDPRVFTIRDSNGAAVDISTWTLSMAVNTDKDPTDTTNEIFSVAGVFVTDGTDGQISFTPPAFSLDAVTAGLKAFYDINRLTPSIKTLVKGNVQFVMDVDKS
jgi:hypothetical protein